MKSRKRTHFKLFLFTGFLLSLLAAYLEFGLLPGDLKAYAIQKIEPAIQRKVRFRKVLYVPFQGLSFYGLKVYKLTGEPIFAAKRFSVRVDLLEFLKTKKFIIRRILIDSFRFDVILEPEADAKKEAPPVTKLTGQINVPTIPENKKIDAEHLADAPELFLPENVFLEEIEISNGTVIFKKTKDGPGLETAHSIDLHVRFQKPPLLEISGSFRLGKNSYAYLGVDGHWNLQSEDYEFNLKTKCDTIPLWLLSYQEGHFLRLEQGKLTITSHLKSLGESRVRFESKCSLVDSLVAVKQTNFSGRMNVATDGIFDWGDKKFETYKGTLQLEDVLVDHLSEKIESLEHLSGTVRFEPDLLDVQSLKGKYKDIGFNAVGKLESFKELRLSGVIESHLSAQNILSLLPPEQKQKIAGWDISGDAQALTHLEGTLLDAKNIRSSHAVQLTNGLVKDKTGKEILKDVSLELSENESAYQIKNAHFTFSGAEYALTLEHPKNADQRGKISLRSKELDLESYYMLAGQKISFDRTQLNYSGIHLEPKGTLENFANPRLDLQGPFQANLETVSLKFADKNAALKTCSPKGLLSGYFSLKGLWNDFKNWDFQADCSSPFLTLQKFKLSNLEFQIRMNNQILNIPYLRSTAYQGMLTGSGLFNLSRPKTSFDARAYLTQMNLAPLGADLELKNKDFSGTGNAQLFLNGTLSEPQTFTGQGFLDVKNGNLFQSDLFKKMGQLPFVRVQGLDMVTFRNLGANFTIHDQKIWTSDLFIHGETVHLNLDGSIGFDQKLDLLMDIHFSNEVIAGAQATGGLVPFVVQEAEDFISQYKVVGTLKEPKYEKQTLPTGKILGKKLSGFLQNLTR